MKKSCFRKKIICICIAVVLLLSMQLCAWAEMKLPEQSEEYYVADYANVLSQETKDDIVSFAPKMKMNYYGIQVVVVTVESLEGNDINAYADALRQKWKVGSKKRDNGVVLLLAIEDNAYTVVCGEGLKQSLSDETITKLLDENLKAEFEAKNYDAAVDQVYFRIAYTAQNEYSTLSVEQNDLIRQVAVGAAILFVVFGLILGGGKFLYWLVGGGFLYGYGRSGGVRPGGKGKSTNGEGE